MAVLTGEEVVDSLSRKIRDAFTPTELAAVYMNKPKQGAHKPYAFLHPLNTEHTNQMQGYALQDYMLDIRVHPLDTQTNVQVWARGIATKMVDTINKIQVSGQQVKARSLTWNVLDDVLHVIVTYQYRVKEVVDTHNAMETIQIEERVK